MAVVGMQVTLVDSQQHRDALFARDPISLLVSQAISQRFNALPDEPFQSLLFWIVPLFFVGVVILGFVIIEMGLLENPRHQDFIDRGCAQHVSLLSQLISCLFHGEQFLGNARCITLKGVDDLAAIGCWVHGQDLLRRADEVAVGMAYPELPHVPGVVCERTHDVCPGLLSLAIDSLNVVDEKDDLHTAAALSRRKQVWALGHPVGGVICCQLKSGFPTRQFSILIYLAGHDTKAQDVLKPGDGLLEVAHTELDPACFGHIGPLSNCCESPDAERTFWNALRLRWRSRSRVM